MLAYNIENIRMRIIGCLATSIINNKNQLNYFLPIKLPIKLFPTHQLIFLIFYCSCLFTFYRAYIRIVIIIQELIHIQIIQVLT